MSSTKISPCLAVLTWFIILREIQDGSQGGDHWWSHRRTWNNEYTIISQHWTNTKLNHCFPAVEIVYHSLPVLYEPKTKKIIIIVCPTPGSSRASNCTNLTHYHPIHAGEHEVVEDDPPPKPRQGHDGIQTYRNQKWHLLGRPSVTSSLFAYSCSSKLPSEQEWLRVQQPQWKDQPPLLHGWLEDR